MQSEKNVYDLIIVGYGAAGLMAAAKAKDMKVLVLEKNNEAGKKVLISGKGQCNFTHKEQVSMFIKHFGEHGNFVKHAIGKWTPADEIDYFEGLGVAHTVMDNGKVFPKSLKAEDIVNTLVAEAISHGVEVRYKRRVEDVKKTESGLFCVEALSQAKGEMTLEKYYGQYLLVTTGGMTYPVTGSEGDGYRLAKQLGHSIVSTRAALSPIYHTKSNLKTLAGVSIPEATIRHSREGKVLGVYAGDLLFTHKGLSGPVILNHSRYFYAGDTLHLHFIKESAQEIEARMLTLASKSGKQTLISALREWCLTKSIADCLFEQLGFPNELSFGELDKIKRKQVVQILTNYLVEIASVGGNQIGMVTAGGVALSEVKAKSMASKKTEGLYFAGEVLDVDGDTGGYNIQWAFSSARAVINEISSKL